MKRQSFFHRQRCHKCGKAFWPNGGAVLLVDPQAGEQPYCWNCADKQMRAGGIVSMRKER